MQPVSVFQVVMLSRTVDIPDQCPKCGISFIDPNDVGLREQRFEDSEVALNLSGDSNAAQEELDYDGSVYVTGYSCNNCGHVLHAPDVTEAGVEWSSKDEPEATDVAKG